LSFGHLRYDKKPEAEMFRILGEGDTPKLYAKKYRVVTNYDWPYAGGNSVDGSEVYIDRTLYRELMTGAVRAKGMEAHQIIRAWCIHEHTEWSVEMGDNPCDLYIPAHEYATTNEHRYVLTLPKNPDRYEEEIAPALRRCLRRFIELGPRAKPPPNVWCGPILDHPDADDRRIIRILKLKGVKDASKLSKSDVSYGIGEKRCFDCSMYGPSINLGAGLRDCALVNGLVHGNRQCDRWRAADRSR
jgi:hypothetical protein